MKRFALLSIVFVLLALMASSSPASAQSETSTPTPTVTYTPMPTRTATPVPFTADTTVLPSGNRFQIEYKADIGQAILATVGLALLALLVVQFVYDLARSWRR